MTCTDRYCSPIESPSIPISPIEDDILVESQAILIFPVKESVSH